ncbi:MAG: hypothetical protein ACLP8S_20600 [Solirubrobacteraceae bacterium]
MSSNTPALLAAAAGVGLGHAVLPDHWVPLAVLGRTRRYPLARVARMSSLAAVAHVLVSIVLGAVVIAVGLQFRSTVQSAQDTIIGCLLIATGLGFLALELSGHGHGHSHDDGGGHDHSHGHAHEHEHHDGHEHGPSEDDRDPDRDRDRARGHARARWLPSRDGLPGLAAVMVPFGAAASPDLTILPVFLAATTAGVATAVGALVLFAAVTIGTIVGLTLAAARGAHQIHGESLDRWGNVFTALVLLVIGGLVFAGVI